MANKRTYTENLDIAIKYADRAEYKYVKSCRDSLGNRSFVKIYTPSGDTVNKTFKRIYKGAGTLPSSDNRTMETRYGKSPTEKIEGAVRRIDENIDMLKNIIDKL